jgi:hypothetical protein
VALQGRCRRWSQPGIGPGRPSIAIDLTYHAILLAALITTLVLLALRRPRAASGQAPKRQRVRSR